MTLDHPAAVRRKITDRERLARTLEDMAAHCDGGALPARPIVDALLESACAQSVPLQDAADFVRWRNLRP
jgi:hypothetical protein